MCSHWFKGFYCTSKFNFFNRDVIHAGNLNSNVSAGCTCTHKLVRYLVFYSAKCVPYIIRTCLFLTELKCLIWNVLQWRNAVTIGTVWVVTKTGKDDRHHILNVRSSSAKVNKIPVFSFLIFTFFRVLCDFTPAAAIYIGLLLSSLFQLCEASRHASLHSDVTWRAWSLPSAVRKT